MEEEGEREKDSSIARGLEELLDIWILAGPGATIGGSLEKFAVSILAIEGIILLGTMVTIDNVLDEEFDNGVELLLLVAGIMNHGGIPGTTLEHDAGEPHAGSGDLGKVVGHEGGVDEGNLTKVLGDGARLGAVLIGLAGTTKEGHGSGMTEVTTNDVVDVNLGLVDLLGGVGVVAHIEIVVDRGSMGLLVLGGGEE